jgi:hypothetical protein
MLCISAALFSLPLFERLHEQGVVRLKRHELLEMALLEIRNRKVGLTARKFSELTFTKLGGSVSIGRMKNVAAYWMVGRRSNSWYPKLIYRNLEK